MSGRGNDFPVYPCGHIVVTVAGLGFSRDDSGDLAATVALASEKLLRRDQEISERRLFL